MRTNMMFLIGCGLACLLASCAVDDGAGEATTEATTESALGKGEVGTSTPTWDYLGTESCFDFFLRPCTSSLPNNQYPNMGQGLPCPQAGIIGNKRLAANTYFEQYYCG